MANALRRGYATASTDTGHTGDDMKFGQGHPEKLIDYGHRAVHVMTESSKLIIRNAAGRFADKSYFVGCSAGGQQALSEAQRYPDDYDGIVAGDPAAQPHPPDVWLPVVVDGHALGGRQADHPAGQARVADEVRRGRVRRHRRLEGRARR